MAEDIQGLLERIQSEGIAKAEAEQKRILEEAEQKAKEILSDAKAKAAEIVKNAEEEASVSEKKGNAAVKQAARDVILSLQSDLQNRLEKLVRDSIGEALTPEVLAKIILSMSEKFMTQESSSLEVLLSKNDADALTAGLKAGLLAGLKAAPEIKVGGGMSAGLKIGIKGSDLYFDFSDDALTDVICSYAGPKVAAAIKE